MWKSHKVICIERKLLLLKPIHGSLVFTLQQCRSKSFFISFHMHRLVFVCFVCQYRIASSSFTSFTFDFNGGSLCIHWLLHLNENLLCSINFFLWKSTISKLKSKLKITKEKNWEEMNTKYIHNAISYLIVGAGRVFRDMWQVTNYNVNSTVRKIISSPAALCVIFSIKCIHTAIQTKNRKIHTHYTRDFEILFIVREFYTLYVYFNISFDKSQFVDSEIKTD